MHWLLPSRRGHWAPRASLTNAAASSPRRSGRARAGSLKSPRDRAAGGPVAEPRRRLSLPRPVQAEEDGPASANPDYGADRVTAGAARRPSAFGPNRNGHEFPPVVQSGSERKGGSSDACWRQRTAASSPAAGQAGDRRRDSVAAAEPEVAERPDLFVSYSRHDVAFVHELAEALRERGKDAWVDWEDIPPTADWRSKVDAGIESSKAFVFVISPDAITSDVCRAGARSRSRGREADRPRRRPSGRRAQRAGAAVRAELDRLRRRAFELVGSRRSWRRWTPISSGSTRTRAPRACGRVGAPRPRQELPSARQRSPRRRELAGRTGAAP